MTRKIELAGIDPDKCAQRNRVMALRYGLETAELELAAAIDPQIKPDFSRGHVPGPDRPDEAMALINALRPPGSPKLSIEDVYILPIMQSANTNFIGDRFMFLGSSTLKNIQAEAAAGFAFMNAHRTGDLSTPSEQPFGRTYAGRYERYPVGPMGSPRQLAAAPNSDEGPVRRFERTLLGTFMMRGVLPNGQGGPSTDDMYRQIMGGVMHDVSMGLNGGAKMCDVCGYELRSENCNHVPGASTNVTKEQNITQRRRGIPKGHATYTLEDAHSGEVSGVYDGAIPGAGFSKAMEYIKLGRLGPRDMSQIRAAYGGLLEAKYMYDENEPTGMLSEEQEASLAQRILRKLGFGIGYAQIASPLLVGPPNYPDLVATSADGASSFTFSLPSADDRNGTDRTGPGIEAPAHEPSGLEKLEAVEREALAARAVAAEEKVNQLEARERHAFADNLVEQKLADGHLLDAGAPAAQLLFRWLSDIDAAGEALRSFTTPVGNSVNTSLVALASAVFDEVPQHNLLMDHAIPEDANIVPAQEPDIDHDTLKAREDAQAIKDSGEKAARRRKAKQG